MEFYTFSFLVLFIIFSFKFFANLFSKSKPLPPGPKPWPIIGNIHKLGDCPHRTVDELSKIYGPIMSLKLGSMTTIVISSPEVAKEMFLDHDLTFSSRFVPRAVELKNHNKYSMVWLPVSPKWRELRKIATIQLFTTHRLNTSQNLRHMKVAELVDYVRKCCDTRVPVDIGKAAFTTSLNLLYNTFFSMDLGSHASSNSHEFKEVVWSLLELSAKPNLSDFFPLLKHLDLQGTLKEATSHLSKMMGTFEEIINQRLNNESKNVSNKDDVLGTLLKIVDKEELSLDHVKHMLLDLFVAGTDTTSSTVEWAMTELLRNPQKMEKAKEEVDKVLEKDGFLKESDISKLPYIQAIVKETFRLHPPAPFLIPHKAEKDVHLSNYLVPKNSTIWVNVWSIGRNSNVWKNPELFIPERFMEREIDYKGRDFELIPFGSGRRICPGMQLAHRMTHLMLGTLIYSFNWECAHGKSPNDLDMRDKFGLTVQKLEPLQAIPLPR